jgi:cyclopropane-fatty-acyl-phospholipid synthase
MSAHHRSSRIERWLVRKIQKEIGPAPVRLVLPSGEEWLLSNELPVATVRIRKRSVMAKLLLLPEVAFGDAYGDGWIEVEGDLVAALEAIYPAVSRASFGRWARELFSRWLEWTQANTLRGSRRNIHHHYNLGNDFYRLWLDAQLVYTCAYFPSPTATLEEAQIAKMDYVCRKLQLQPGERVVEAGCGWGALALHMARHYGVSVKAFNISQEQIRYAQERARREGLDGKVEFIEDDYRGISGPFDVFVSVGMLEHVGAAHYGELGQVIHRAIGDAGRGLLHFIGRNRPNPLSAWVRRRIFPGAYPPTLRQALDVFEPWDFAVLDVENLRMHYAKTLEHWLERFEKSAARVAAMFDEQFMRMWRLYLAGSVASFLTGSMQLFQVVFAGRACQRIPWTRAHLYTNERPAEQEAKWIAATS